MPWYRLSQKNAKNFGRNKRNVRERDRDVRENNRDIRGGFFKKNKRHIAWIIPLILIVLLSTTCVYTVDQTEYAIITTFGKPNEQPVSSGLRLKLPYPIQSVTKLSKETFSTTFGYKVQNGEEVIFEEETKMITGG